MELINATGMAAGYTLGMEPSGRELLVVVVKGTFHLPPDGGAARRHELQQPLIMADTFTGAPGLSAPYGEVDFAPHKDRCDILLQGSAHAPGGVPATRVPVGIRVGGWTKTFAVVGARHWQSRLAGVSASAPAPFVVRSVSYDNAFGGMDVHHPDPARHAAFDANPIGRGFHRHLNSEWVDGSPLPDTEELERPVEAPDGAYRPMALGPVGRGWAPRRRYAGTYDQDWVDNTFPFLPADFDGRYYQAAPPDQQIACPAGGEPVALVNLTPAGRTSFLLPALTVPVAFFRRRAGHDVVAATLDTIAIHADQGWLTLTWRASRVLRRDIFEVPQVLAGRMPRGWWRARTMGKTWYPSLAALARPTGE